MTQFSHPHAKCSVCGKETIITSTRDKGPYFCSRVCSTNRTYYSRRYRGGTQKDKPNIMDKRKEY